jgi:hypothetical protein
LSGAEREKLRRFLKSILDELLRNSVVGDVEKADAAASGAYLPGYSVPILPILRIETGNIDNWNTAGHGKLSIKELSSLILQRTCPGSFTSADMVMLKIATSMKKL